MGRKIKHHHILVLLVAITVVSYSLYEWYEHRTQPAVAAADINATSFWVATGNDLKYSDDDGVTWNTASYDCAVPRVVAHNADLWLGGSSGTCIMSSTDGINWTQTNFSAFAAVDALAWNGSKWVAGSSASRQISYSSNGIDWSAAVDVPVGPLGIGSNGSRFVAVGATNLGNSIMYSDDGIDWTGVANPFSGGTGRGVAYNGSRWVIGGGTNKATAIQYSDDDGVTWNPATLPVSLTSGNIFNIAWNGTRFVATSNFDDGVLVTPILYSDDGITWTKLTGVFGGEADAAGVAWNGTVFMAGANTFGTNRMISSPDGITWSTHGSPLTSVYSISGAPAPGLFPAQVAAVATPTPAPGGFSCSGFLSVSVVMSGVASPSADVDLFLNGSIMDADFTYQLGCTQQQISASPLSGYTQTFSGACSSTGSVLVTNGTTQNCIVTFTSLVTPSPSLSPIASASLSPLVSASVSPSATPSISATPLLTPSATPTPPPSPSATLPVASVTAPPVTPDIPRPSTPPPAPPAPLSVALGVITAVASALADNPVTSSAAFTLISLLPLLSVSASAVFQNLNTASTFSSLAQTTGQILGLKRKPTVWGSVYDSVTKHPLSFVKIELRDAQQRVLETKFADKDGRYGFLTNPQALNLPSLAVSINPIHNGYQFPSQRVLSDPDFFAYDHVYKGGLVTINQGAVVNYNIPLDSTAAVTSGVATKTPLPGLQSLAVRALDIAFWAGLVILPYNAFTRPSLWTIGLVAFFALANGLRISAKLARPYGVILDSNARPLPFALITVDDATNKRLDFAVSDELGRFFLLISPEAHHLTLHTPAQVVPAKTTTYPLKKKKGWIGGVVRI